MRLGGWRFGGLLAVGIGLTAAVLAAPVRAQAAAAGRPPSSMSAIAEREARRDTSGLAHALARGGSPALRAAAARALGRIQNRGSVRVLLPALADKAAPVRREAAFALGLVGDSTAAPLLAARLTVEKDPGVRTSILTAVGYLGGHGVGAALARSLLSSRAEERWAAAMAAGRSRVSTRVEPHARAAQEPQAALRWRVAYALGRIGDPRAGNALRTLLADKDETVRYSAARALGDVRDTTAAPALLRALDDRAWRVRANAAHALGALRPPSAAARLRALLADASAHVRWEAALALGALRDAASAAPLAAALRDSASGVAQAAGIALLQTRGEEAVVTIAPALDLLPSFLRYGLIDALGDLSGPGSLELLMARVRDASDPAQAAGAASALARRRGDRVAAFPALREALGAKDFAVKASAAEALGTLGDSTAVPELARLLALRRTPEDADVAASAATALAALKTSAALEALRGARRDPERRIRETAALALGLPADSVAAEPAPPLRIDPIPKRPATSAVVRTDRGIFRIALHPSSAPRTVANFARLARAGYFNGLAFHRVVPNFVIQDGCPRGDGWGGPGYAIPCEYNELPYKTGTVGMALAGKDTGGSQWFVTLSPQPRLEGRYTVFGDVTQGMDVVERMMPGDRILSVRVAP